jgi:hypothetical protein
MKVVTRFLNPSWNCLEELLISARNSVFISSPWISKEGNKFLQFITQRLSDREINTIELWTRFDPADYLFQTSDHGGILSTLKLCIKTFRNLDLRIWTHPKLHAKVYAVDGKRALLTSANLTQGGFVENIETAMLIEGEKKIADLFQLIKKDQKQMTKVSIGEVESFVNSLQKADIARKNADKAMTILSQSKVIPLGGTQRKQKAPPYISIR